jgi:hypothetical protein
MITLYMEKISTIVELIVFRFYLMFLGKISANSHRRLFLVLYFITEALIILKLKGMSMIKYFPNIKAVFFIHISY